MRKTPPLFQLLQLVDFTETFPFAKTRAMMDVRMQAALFATLMQLVGAAASAHAGTIAGHVTARTQIWF